MVNEEPTTNEKSRTHEYIEAETGSDNFGFRLALDVGLACALLALLVGDFVVNSNIWSLLLAVLVIVPLFTAFIIWDLSTFNQSRSGIVLGEGYVEMPLSVLQGGIGKRTMRLKDEEVKQVAPVRNSLMESPHNTLIRAMTVVTTDGTSYERLYQDHQDRKVQAIIEETASVLKEHFGERYEDKQASLL